MSGEAPSPCGRGSSFKVLLKKVNLGGSTNLEYNTIKVFRHSLKRKIASESNLILKGHLKIPSIISNGYIFRIDLLQNYFYVIVEVWLFGTAKFNS